MTLFAKTVAERTRPGQRQDVEEQGIPPLDRCPRAPDGQRTHSPPLQTTRSTPTGAPRVSVAS